MPDQETTHYILERLVDHADPDDIAYALCEKLGITWDDALSMITFVQVKHNQNIARRQFPILIAVALLTFIGGVALIAASLVGIYHYAGQMIAEGSTLGLQTNILLLLFENAPFYFGLIGLGLAMAVGSLVGMRQTWSKLLFGE